MNINYFLFKLVSIKKKELKNYMLPKALFTKLKIDSDLEKNKSFFCLKMKFFQINF